MIFRDKNSGKSPERFFLNIPQNFKRHHRDMDGRVSLQPEYSTDLPYRNPGL